MSFVAEVRLETLTIIKQNNILAIAIQFNIIDIHPRQSYACSKLPLKICQFLFNVTNVLPRQ